MKQTSKKTIKKTRTRKDHPAGFRVSTEERAKMLSEVADIKAKSGIEISMAAYAKHAAIDHGRLRRMETKLIGWRADLVKTPEYDSRVLNMLDDILLPDGE